jgi:ParB family chromosome partitioning protein
LGRGLEALLPASGLQHLPVESILPNPLQPRRTMDEGELEELAASIRQHGVLQPVVVTRSAEPGKYHLVVGERRWRAAQRAGLQTIPALVRSAGTREALELALVENLQRADLSPLEEAEAFHTLLSEFGLTQEQIAERVGKSRSAVANTLRLRNLPQAAKEALEAGQITAGHARALLALAPELQVQVLGEILQRGLNVRQTEQLIQHLQATPKIRPARPPDPLTAEWEDLLRRSLATKVEIQHRGKAGRIVIHYYSLEELHSLVERLGGEE